MKTTLLSAAAALLLASISPVCGFAQQIDDGYRPLANDDDGMHYRGDHGRRSEDGQIEQNMDRGGERWQRWRDMRAMMMARGGARFHFRRDGNALDIQCPPNEPVLDCVEAASRLIDKVRTMTPAASSQAPALPPEGRPTPETRPTPGAAPNQQ